MTRREKRNRFSRWLSELLNFGKAGIQPRRILVEPLEKREVFAADPFLGLLGSSYSISNDTAQDVGLPTSEGESDLVAEGEDAVDLVAFAKFLASSSFTFYGADWCPHCKEQKALFQDGAKYLPFVEVTNGDRTSNQIGIDEQITSYPTWDFGNGDENRVTGVLTLAQLEAKVRTVLNLPNYTMPKSSTPFMAELLPVNVGFGSPLMVPIDGYDPNGNPLTITVTSSNSNLIEATPLTGNRSWKLDTSFGDMTFQLFEDKAPRPTSRIVELTNSGFYNGITFHRVEQGFVLQAGDPAANGTGGSTLADFDDQFNVDLQHNRSGILSYAKSLDDTNDSQFFITASPQRDLDFNHSIFGQMTEGDAVRQAIDRTKTSTVGSGRNAFQKPDIPITINSATIFTDTENGVIQLKAKGNTTGSATITVTITDSEGRSTSRSFTANVVQDTSNSSPFLNDIPVVRTTVGTPVNVTLTSQDVEGDTPTYNAVAMGSLPTSNISRNSSTGLVTVTPPAGFSGQLQFRASVSQLGVSNAPTDEQVVTVLVGPSAPTSVDLVTASDSGASSTDNITNATTLTFTVTGTAAGATVKLKAGGNVVGQANATSATTTVSVTNPASLGQGPILFTATQTVDSQESADSPSLSVTYDTAGPTALASSVFPTTVQASQALNLNLAHSEEGNGLVYAVSNAPSGLTINSSTGAISWTPTTNQIGAQTFTLGLTDAAGNSTNQQVSLTVVGQPTVGLTLQVVNMGGAPITTIAAGQNFKVQVLVQDLRNGADAKGVFAAFADLMYDSNVIEPIATNPISHGVYPNSPNGVVRNGVVDELGGLAQNFSVSSNGDKYLLAEVTFLAKVSGNANLRLDPPDDSLSDVLLFETTTEVPNSEISFGSSNFSVGVNFTLVNDTFNFDEDSGVKVINPLTNDTVTDTAVLTISSVGARSGGGTVTIGAGGTSLNYTSAPNFNGVETFTYTARNQAGAEQTATVTVQVTDVNDPPVAVNDTFNVFSNSTQNVFEVLTNDTKGVDAGATETLTVTAVSAGSQGGTITIGPSGLSIRYTPQTGFTGPTETFTYTLSDGRGGTASGTVSVNVAPENPPPTAVADNFAAVEDAVQATFNPLTNDTTSDVGETLKVASVGTSSNGSQVSVATDGLTILYKPGLNFAGTEVITYVLQDSRGANTNGQMTFTVSAVNDAPNAADDAVTVQTAVSTTTLNVLTNDVNPDTGETLTITAVTQPPTGKGTIAISSDSKSLIYTSPSTTFEGTFSFTYTLSDGTSLTDTATVNVTAQAFTPRSIGGEVAAGGFTSSNNSGFGGISLRLSGTDYAGQPVAARTFVAPDGSYAYDNLAPGEYSIAREALPFLHDSPQAIQVASAANSGNQLNNVIQVGSLMPNYFDIRDFLGSTPKNSLTVALNADGTQSWYATQGDWAGLKNVVVKANGSGDSLVVDITNGGSTRLTGTVPITNAARVMQLGQQSSMKLLRIVGTPTEAGITTTPPSTVIPTEPPNASPSNRAVGANGSNAATELTTTSTGLQYAILRDGSNVKANSDSSKVKVDYKGWLDNGTIFDSSYARSDTSEFELSRVIDGWTEGLKLVGEGGKIQLRIPASLGYKAVPQNNIPANSTLNFIVEVKTVTNPASGEGELAAEGEGGVASPLVSSPVTSSLLTSQTTNQIQPGVLTPSQAIRQVLGSASASTQVLSPSAVDGAMQQVRAKPQLQLASELEDVLASENLRNGGLS